MASSDVVVACADLDAALAFYTDELGFRLLSIFPADDPAVATLDGHRLSVRLERSGPAAVVDGTWQRGRAGMHYRDLISDRLGGHFIASHIRIPDGGPVPDYVHYHEIQFQMIYCYKGWVRVVYEDQGPPFVLRAGDCVLQAPGIRHRVLESSANLEVVEVGSPAAHLTCVDHELSLPTAEVRPDREFGGQRFVRHVAAEADWQPWRIDGFENRDTGISGATNDLAGANVVRPIGRTSLRVDIELAFVFVLVGSATKDAAALTAGDSFVVDGVLELGELSDELELLLVTLPPRAD